MEAAWPVLFPGEDHKLPLIVPEHHHQVDPWLISAVVLPTSQDLQDPKKPEGEGSSVRTFQGQKPSGKAHRGGDAYFRCAQDGDVDAGVPIITELSPKRNVLPRKGLKVEVVGHRGAATRAIVYEGEMG